uniref:Uncharacterized protein n=1 Tax=Romanomermis culicivorax TaxID=13658 RepID=A0A915JRS7_ROMCU
MQSVRLIGADHQRFGDRSFEKAFDRQRRIWLVVLTSSLLPPFNALATWVARMGLKWSSLLKQNLSFESRSK